MTTSTHTHRELDARSGDGLDIRLLWSPADNTVIVTVADLRSGELFIIPVAAREAHDAFQHPFSYAGAPALDATPVVRDAHVTSDSGDVRAG
jgi:hypothetical protein